MSSASRWGFDRRGWAVPLLFLALAGCGAPPPGPVVSPVPTSTAEQVVLYFPHRSRPVLVREVRQAARQGEQPEWFALILLLRGPESPQARPVFPGLPAAGAPGGPEQVTISAKVLEGDLSLLLTRAAADALVRGNDLLPVYALVNTLASFPRVRSVYFAVEGRGEPVRVAGVDLSRPLAPRWDLVQSPVGSQGR